VERIINSDAVRELAALFHERVMNNRACACAETLTRRLIRTRKWISRYAIIRADNSIPDVLLISDVIIRLQTRIGVFARSAGSAVNSLSKSGSRMELVGHRRRNQSNPDVQRRRVRRIAALMCRCDFDTYTWPRKREHIAHRNRSVIKHCPNIHDRYPGLFN